MNDESESHSTRILLFGGTFDPPHLAHARLPELASQQLKCDQIIYIPAAMNPLKAEPRPTAAHHRLAMLLLAIADVPNAKINTIELDREGKSYTIDTLRQLDRHHAPALSKAQAARSSKHTGSTKRAATLEPRGCFYLLIGCDQALDFHRWKEWQEVLKLATPAVMIRPPWTHTTFGQELKARYAKAEADRWLGWTLNLPLMDVSATDVRDRLKKGEKLDGLLDPAVVEYIRSNGLYR